MYLRFITGEVDNRTGKMKGIFTLAYELLDEKLLSGNDETQVKELLSWFSKNLNIPNNLQDISMNNLKMNESGKKNKKILLVLILINKPRLLMT